MDHIVSCRVGLFNMCVVLIIDLRPSCRHDIIRL